MIENGSILALKLSKQVGGRTVISKFKPPNFKSHVGKNEPVILEMHEIGNGRL